MKNRLLLIIGIGIGYVLGARAGRESYDRIAAKASKFWNSPRVQTQVAHAEDFVKDKAPAAADLIADGAKKVVRKAASKDSGASNNSGSTATGSNSK